MRLIDAAKVVNDFKIEFNTNLQEEDEDNDGGILDDTKRPQYAILSHTWGWFDENTGLWGHKADEVTYNERHKFSNPFEEPLHPDKQKAYQKIYYACRRALDLGCDYVWIDTCCIDKSNSAELTESINSMFSWYSDAAVCLVYLADSPGPPQMLDGDPYLFWRLYTEKNKPCRWFSRCWTLQELLASKKLEFYDGKWAHMGTLQDEGPTNPGWLLTEISEITRVDTQALLGRVPLWEYSVEAKMSWASNRKCGRPEDIAYSLLGIFDIHMPLIYGEGARAAFQRLQLEIMKSTPDLSLFAWHTTKPLLEGQFCSILADSPSQFRFDRRICRSIPESHHTMTNKGIQMTAIIHRVLTEGKERYFLCLEDQGAPNKAVGIFVRKMGYDVFQRSEESLTEVKDLTTHPSAHRSMVYITTSLRQHVSESHGFHDGDIYVPPNYLIYDVVPEAAWDCENRKLLGGIPCNDGIRAVKVGSIESGIYITVGLVFRSSGIIAFDCNRDPGISGNLFTRTHKRSYINWNELVSKIPEMRHLSNEVNMPDGTLKVNVLSDGQNPSQLFIEVAARVGAGPSEYDASLRGPHAHNNGWLAMASRSAHLLTATIDPADLSNMSSGNSHLASVDSDTMGRKTVRLSNRTVMAQQYLSNTISKNERLVMMDSYATGRKTVPLNSKTPSNRWQHLGNSSFASNPAKRELDFSFLASGD